MHDVVLTPATKTEHTNCWLAIVSKYQVPFVVSSDAHFAGRVGDFQASLDTLESILFPEELILNADKKVFDACIQSKRTQP